MKTARVSVNHRKTALNACTMCGRWQPAPASGSGLPDGKPEEYLHHSKMAPHCGIVYTPPKWSDHVGVSMACDAMPVLDHHTRAKCLHSINSNQKKATRRCQPHKSQRSIASFFGKRGRDMSKHTRSGAKAGGDSGMKNVVSTHKSSGGSTVVPSRSSEPPSKKKRVKANTTGFRKLFGLKRG